MRSIVKEVAKYFPTAIISGRSRDKVTKELVLKQMNVIFWWLHVHLFFFGSCFHSTFWWFLYSGVWVCRTNRTLLCGKSWYGYHGSCQAICNWLPSKLYQVYGQAGINILVPLCSFLASTLNFLNWVYNLIFLNVGQRS